MEFCRPLGDLRRDDEPAFGGKSTGLGELLAAGIPVPPGFALATAAFQTFIDDAGLQPGAGAEHLKRRDRNSQLGGRGGLERRGARRGDKHLTGRQIGDDRRRVRAERG